MPTSVTVPFEIVQTLVVAEVIVVASALDAVAATVKVPEVTVRAAMPAKLITLLPWPIVSVKVCELDAMLESVGVNVPVMVTVPGFRMLKVVPEESAATVESLEAKAQVPATTPETAGELTAGAVTVYVAPGAYVTVEFDIAPAVLLAVAMVRVWVWVVGA